MDTSYKQGTSIDELSALRAQLSRLNQQIEQYLDLESSADDDEYVARGNGFCDSKYSESFLEQQIERLQSEAATCRKRLAELER